ncbi:MAG: FHA domain-containing protein [Myxococcales bacterium]|nr:FHA domain-containing protein [Myxococcales bacterium]
MREGDAPAIVGRNPGCAIQTNNPSVSRNHVKIGYEGGQVVIKDLGSSNGTFVNDAPVTKVALNNNDVIKCGDFVIRFQDDDGRGGFTPARDQDPYAQTTARDPYGDSGGIPEPSRTMKRRSGGRRASNDWRGALDEPAPEPAPSRADSGDADRLREENRELRRANSELQAQLDSARAEADRSRRSRHSSVSDDDLRDKDNKISELEAKVVRHSVEVESLTEKYSQLKEQTSLQKKLLDDARGDVAERDDSIKDLKEQLRALREQVDTAHSSTSESSETIANLKIKVNQKERQVEEMQRQLDLFEYELKSAREENEAMQASFNEGGNEVSQLERRINHLQEVLSEKENLIDHLKNEMHEKEVELEDTRMGMGYKDLEEEKRKLLEDYYQRARDIDKLRERIDELSQENRQKTEENFELQRRLEEKLDLDNIAEYQQVKREIEKKHKELEIFQKKMDEVKAERDQVLGEFSPDEKKRLIGENAFLKKQNAALQERCEQLEAGGGSRRSGDSGSSDGSLEEIRSKTMSLYDHLNEVLGDWRNNLMMVRNYVKDVTKCLDAYGKIGEDDLPADVRRSLKYLEPAESMESLNNIIRIVLKDADNLQDELRAFENVVNP